MDLVAWAAWALGGWHGHVINCVDWATGDMFLGGHGIVAVGLFSGALASYARRGFAGWGINCVDRATGDWRLPGGVGSAQLVYFGVVGIVRAVRIRCRGRGINSLDWEAGDRHNTGGRGISAVGLFWGCGHCMRGVDSLGPPPK